MSDIDSVRAFWERHPLWSGESTHPVGSDEFFAEHRSVYLDECFGGRFDERFLPPPRQNGRDIRVLDLGCGNGFWTAEFAMRGLQHLVAADLTEQALALTRRRLEATGGAAELRLENAESLTFADASFDHVNCQGVVHHTPDTALAIAEIARVLRCDGTASVSVYYRSPVLRVWPYIGWVGTWLARRGAGLKGRGRERIFLERDPDEIVRLYDGAENPIGKCFTKRQFRMLLEPWFEIEETYLHYFPTRSLPFPIPRFARSWFDRHLGFMLYASVRRRPATGGE